VNRILDSRAALMLATQPPDPELMRMPPQGRAPLVSRVMIKYMVGHALYQLAMLLWLTLTDAGVKVFGLDPARQAHSVEHYTNVYSTFIWLQLFNLLNVRRIQDQWDILRGVTRSPTAAAVVVAIIVMQVIIVQAGGEAFQTVPLSAREWFIDIGLGATSLVVGALLRLIPYRDRDGPRGRAARGSAGRGGGDAIQSPRSGAATAGSYLPPKAIVPVTLSQEGALTVRVAEGAGGVAAPAPAPARGSTTGLRAAPAGGREASEASQSGAVDFTAVGVRPGL
jgi:hypothetical protein